MPCLEITEMLPGILNQLGAESLTHLKRLAGNVNSLSGGGMMGMQPTVEEEDEDVPGIATYLTQVLLSEL